VLEHRRFACPTHAANEQQVALREQALLDLQDVEVATDKAVLRLGRRVPLFGQLALVVGAALLRFSYANVCKHTFTANFVVPVSSVGASGPKPFGLTPRPQAS
jgi:hypothetical protein